MKKNQFPEIKLEKFPGIPNTTYEVAVSIYAYCKKKETGYSLFKKISKFLIYSPQILSFPSSHVRTRSVVTDFGLSIGKPNARSQQRLASTPSERLTANSTV